MDSTHVALLNPFRYKSYVYDNETELYYLNSRYYDPQVCRFVSRDDFSYLGADGAPLSYNLFAYCGNNPIMGYDPYGTFDWGSFFQGSTWLTTGIAAVAIGVSVLTCGVASPAIMAIATVTVATGAATTVNGTSEIGEAFTGYNAVRDGVFQGDSAAYSTYAYTTATAAQIGIAVCGGWAAKNSPRMNAYSNMDSYNVKKKHLSTDGGDWSKFNTTSQTELRKLGKEALKNSPMRSLLPNSADSYTAIYNYGRVIGTSGQTCARLIFSETGKIITFFPQ